MNLKPKCSPASTMAATLGVVFATLVVVVSFTLFGWIGLGTVTLVAAAGLR